jgi:ribosome assembly protein 1
MPWRSRRTRSWTTTIAEDFQEKDDEDIYFAPEKGNVVFASALGGWGFRIAKFAQIFAVKLGIKEANFKRVLWGDFYLDPKTKRVITVTSTSVAVR